MTDCRYKNNDMGFGLGGQEPSVARLDPGTQEKPVKTELKHI